MVVYKKKRNDEIEGATFLLTRVFFLRIFFFIPTRYRDFLCLKPHVVTALQTSSYQVFRQGMNSTSYEFIPDQRRDML